MKLLLVFFALFVCLIGYTNATVCGYNRKSKQYANFVDQAAFDKADRERRKIFTRTL